MIEQKFGWRREDSSAAPLPRDPGDNAIPDSEAAPSDSPVAAIARRRPVLKAVFPSAGD